MDEGPGLRWLELGIRAPVTDNKASILVHICGRGVLERDGWVTCTLKNPMTYLALLNA